MAKSLSEEENNLHHGLEVGTIVTNTSETFSKLMVHISYFYISELWRSDLESLSFSVFFKSNVIFF